MSLPILPARAGARRGALTCLVWAIALVLVGCGLPWSEPHGRHTSTDGARAASPRPNGPLWMVVGQGVSVFGGGASVAKYDVAAGTLTSIPVSAPPDALWSVTGLGVAPNGSALAMSAGGGEFPPRNIILANGDGTGFQQLTSGQYWEMTPAWLPDGKTILFVSDRSTATRSSTGTYQLYTIDRDGQDLRQLTESSDDDLLPAVSAEGAIAFVRTVRATGASSIWVMGADGDSPRRIVAFDDRSPTAITWSSDARHLLVATSGVNGTDPRIDQVGVDDVKPRPQTVYRCSGPCANAGGLAASPDGRAIALTQYGLHGDATVIIVDLATGRGRPASGGPTSGACCLAWQARPENEEG